jgi:hypothetical protein
MNKTRGYGKPKIPVGKRNSKQQKGSNAPKKQKQVNEIWGKQLVIKESNAPVSKSFKLSVSKPKLSKIGSLRVKHCELLTDVVTDTSYSGGFNVFKCAINPGLSRLFPWLAGIARNFQEYKCKSIRFVYIPECATSVQGQILMSASYDPSLPIPQTETDMSSYEGMVADSAWQSLVFDLSPKGLNSQLHYYVRGSNPNTSILNEDIKLLDCANFFVAYDNINQISGSNPLYLGKVWVEYDFELLHPFSNSGYQQVISSNSIYVVGTATSLTKPFGASTSLNGSVANSIWNSTTGSTYGKFISGNWSAYTGTTNTWLSLQGVGTKVFKTSITGGTVINGLILTLYQYTGSINDDGNVGFVESVSDPLELMTLADTKLSTYFTQLSTSTNILTSTTLTNVSSTQGSVSYLMNIPTSSVILITATGAASTISGSTLFVSDADFSIPSISTTFASIQG